MKFTAEAHWHSFVVHKCPNRLFAQQGDVIQFLHLPINADDCQKRTDYF
jgi:hypothetical protein